MVLTNNNLKLIPGKAIAVAKLDLLSQKLSATGNKPVLKIFQVGEDPASTLYVNLKVDYARKLGFIAEPVRYGLESSPLEIAEDISKKCSENGTHGVMLQSPVQGLLLRDALVLFNSILPEKDVDGLTYASLGKLWQLKQISDLDNSNDFFISATPLAVVDCLTWLSASLSGEQSQSAIAMAAHADWGYKQKQLTQLLQGKNVLIVNRSNIVGKPLAAILQMANATVTLAHSYTQDLKARMLDYDFVLLATGVKGFVSIDQFRPGQIVIDIGINSTPGEIIAGDVSFKLESESIISNNHLETDKNLYLAPVPGGVGPLTVANLLWNTYLSSIHNKQ